MSDSNERYARYTREDEDGPDIGLYLKAVSEEAKEWFEAQKAVSKLEVSEHVAKLSTMLVYGLVLGLIVATVLVLWFIALALWFGKLLDDTALGFLAAGGLFLLLGLVFYIVWHAFLRDKVMLAVINAMHAPD